MSDSVAAASAFEYLLIFKIGAKNQLKIKYIHSDFTQKNIQDKRKARLESSTLDSHELKLYVCFKSND